MTAETQNPSHFPVMLPQVLEGLRIRKDGRYLDGTLGRGGHARAVLERLGPEGRLLLMDKDPEAIASAERLFAADDRVAWRRHVRDVQPTSRSGRPPHARAADCGFRVVREVP